MPSSEASLAGPLLQSVLEWQIQGALNGATVAPGLEVSNNVLTQKPAAFGSPFVIPVSGPAGLFTPDAINGIPARADRYIQWIRLVPGTFPIPAGFRLQIVDASGLVPSVSAFVILEQLHAGAFFDPGLYLSEMNLCPQGAMIRIDGLGAAPPGRFHRLTVGIRSASEIQDDPALDQSSCCLFEPVAQAQLDEA